MIQFKARKLTKSKSMAPNWKNLYVNSFDGKSKAKTQSYLPKSIMTGSAIYSPRFKKRNVLKSPPNFSYSKLFN